MEADVIKFKKISGISEENHEKSQASVADFLAEI